MSNSIDKLISQVHNFGKSIKSNQPCKLVVPTYSEPSVKSSQPCKLNIDNETVSYIKIMVAGHELTGQAAIDYLNQV